MQEWISHFYTDTAGGLYDTVQMLRPDYEKAMITLRQKANAVLHGKSGKIVVLDVACGSAMATRQVFGDNNALIGRPIRFIGLDSDSVLLNEAKQHWPQLEQHKDDMVRAKIKETFDLILCSFAYHHVPDSEKPKLCENLKNWCKPDGNLLVLEICLTEDQVHEYYEEIKKVFLASPMREFGGKFIDWTMSPDHVSNGEWKVSMARLQKDFKQAGWKLCERKAIWTAPSLPSQTGCYFLHFQPKD